MTRSPLARHKMFGTTVARRVRVVRACTFAVEELAARASAEAVGKAPGEFVHEEQALPRRACRLPVVAQHGGQRIGALRANWKARSPRRRRSGGLAVGCAGEAAVGELATGRFAAHRSFFPARIRQRTSTARAGIAKSGSLRRAICGHMPKLLLKGGGAGFQSAARPIGAGFASTPTRAGAGGAGKREWPSA